MTTHQQIIRIISRIRNSHSEMENIFTNGSCLNFYLILKVIFPQAKPLYNVDHVITEIDGKYYDIRGQIFDIRGYDYFDNIYPLKGKLRAFRSMLKSQYENNFSIRHSP